MFTAPRVVASFQQLQDADGGPWEGQGVCWLTSGTPDWVPSAGALMHLGTQFPLGTGVRGVAGTTGACLLGIEGWVRASGPELLLEHRVIYSSQLLRPFPPQDHM
jgi:hypothetical protein